jgi:hypothetical protein
LAFGQTFYFEVLPMQNFIKYIARLTDGLFCVKHGQ